MQLADVRLGGFYQVGTGPGEVRSDYVLYLSDDVESEEFVPLRPGDRVLVVEHRPFCDDSDRVIHEFKAIVNGMVGWISLQIIEPIE